MTHDELRADASLHTGLDLDDRRRHPRRATTAAIRVRIDTRELDGQAENLSTGGVLFFTDGELRVTVEIDDSDAGRVGATPITRSGRLVRAQRLRGEHIGWAVEFDPS